MFVFEYTFLSVANTPMYYVFITYLFGNVTTENSENNSVKQKHYHLLDKLKWIPHV